MQARGRGVAVLLPNHYNANLFRTIRNCVIGGGGNILIVGFKEGEPLTDSERQEVFTIDVANEDLGLGDYDALVILDSATPEEMRASRKNLDLILRSYEHQKVVGAVDRGVELLVAAMGNLLSNRKATGPAESRIDLEGAGSVYVDRSVVVDGFLITAKTLNDAERFCQVLLDRLQAMGGMAA